MSFKDLIEEETTPLIPRDRILIGGFSQGGSVAFHNILLDKRPLAGCIGLSTYLAGGKSPLEYDRAFKSETPTLQCHGYCDEIVPIEKAHASNCILGRFVKDVRWVEFTSMGHETCQQELLTVREFMLKQVPDNGNSWG